MVENYNKLLKFKQLSAYAVLRSWLCRQFQSLRSSSSSSTWERKEKRKYSSRTWGSAFKWGERAIDRALEHSGGAGILNSIWLKFGCWSDLWPLQNETARRLRLAGSEGLQLSQRLWLWGQIEGLFLLPVNIEKWFTFSISTSEFWREWNGIIVSSVWWIAYLLGLQSEF